MQQSKKIPNFNEDGLDEKKLKGNLEAAAKALVLSLRSVAWYKSCEFSCELANVVCRSTCRIQRLLIGDFTCTTSNDERRGQERLNYKVSVRYKWFAKFMIHKFRWVFPVFSSNLMFLQRVVPLFFQTAEQRPWCWVQGPWHESCEFSYELASVNVVYWNTCYV